MPKKKKYPALTVDEMKYPTLKALGEALRSGEEPYAHCYFDKEFVAITSKKSSQPGEEGEVLFECVEVDFFDEAFEALGIATD